MKETTESRHYLYLGILLAIAGEVQSYDIIGGLMSIVSLFVLLRSFLLVINSEE